MKISKKLLCIIIAAAVVIGSAIACCVLCCDEEEQPIEPPLELMHKTLNEKYNFALIDAEGTELLEGEDVEGLYIMYKKGENRYLEIRFTEDGAEKFEDAMDDNDELTITLDGEVLKAGVKANEETPDRAKITGSYDTIMNWFNEMT